MSNTDDLLGQEDLVEYVEKYSDFAFEMQVLRQLESAGYLCEHGGTYTDLLSGKAREFDIRATKRALNRRLCAAVECKKFRGPLLVHRSRRGKLAARHDLIEVIRPGHADFGETVIPVERDSFYLPNDFMGQSADQPSKKNGRWTNPDRDAFDKISQALGSAGDLFGKGFDQGVPRDIARIATFVCPVLVVPDQALWAVDYSSRGETVGPPKQVDRVSYFVGRKYSISSAATKRTFTYTISHLEIVCLSELLNVLNGFLHSDPEEWLLAD